jgi:hypothetical protein
MDDRNAYLRQRHAQPPAREVQVLAQNAQEQAVRGNLPQAEFAGFNPRMEDRAAGLLVVALEYFSSSRF